MGGDPAPDSAAAQLEAATVAANHSAPSTSGQQSASPQQKQPQQQQSRPGPASLAVQSDAAPAAAATAAASGSGVLQLKPEDLRRLQQLQLAAVKEQKGSSMHQFWETQPVAQFGDSRPHEGREGPIDVVKTVADVKQEPYKLPEGFEWAVCHVAEDERAKEVFELLKNNYVEDDDSMFRFLYSMDFLRWALLPPGYQPEWHLGVRVTKSRKLVAFISAIPATIRAMTTSISMVEINYLCVHKKLRSKRLAPVLIKEITRRVNLHNIWQAAYTAGVVIPTPVAQCRYWHRSLNPKKLIEIKFSRLAPRMTMARTLKLNRLPDEPATKGIRPLEPRDVPQVTALLNTYLKGFKLSQVFDEEEVAHWLRPVADVVDVYVVASPEGTVTDLVSFYHLPSTILGHPDYDVLKVAYLFYTVATSVPLSQLLHDALVLARNIGYDVFNALDMMQNTDETLKQLKFGPGDGQLNYYLFNWMVPQALTPSDVGLILL